VLHGQRLGRRDLPQEFSRVEEGVDRRDPENNAGRSSGAERDVVSSHQRDTEEIRQNDCDSGHVVHPQAEQSRQRKKVHADDEADAGGHQIKPMKTERYGYDNRACRSFKEADHSEGLAETRPQLVGRCGAGFHAHLTLANRLDRRG